MVEMTYLVTIEQASFDILYALMMADGQELDEEMEVVKSFLKQEHIHKSALFDTKMPFYGECNHIKEFYYLRSLDKQSLERRFKKAVTSISEWIKEGDQANILKEDLITFALKLIAADGKISEEEKRYIDFIAAEWKIDIKKYQ